MGFGNITAAKLMGSEELPQPGFALHVDTEALIAGVRTIFAVLDDERSMQRVPYAAASS